jgi:hypothetical protein
VRALTGTTHARTATVANAIAALARAPVARAKYRTAATAVPSHLRHVVPNMEQSSRTGGDRCPGPDPNRALVVETRDGAKARTGT